MRSARRGGTRPGCLDQLRAFEDGQEGQDEDGDRADEPGAHASQEVERRGAEGTGERADAFLVVLHELQGVGALEQVADRSAARAGVVDDPG